MIGGRCHSNGGALDVATEHTMMHTRVHCLHVFQLAEMCLVVYKDSMNRWKVDDEGCEYRNMTT